MKADQQAELEQVARAYIQRLPFAGTLGEHDNAVRKLVTLLAAQRAAVLEEAATDWQKCLLGGTHVEILSLVRCLRRKAKEQQQWPRY